MLEVSVPFTNVHVKKAIEALQAANSEDWFKCFNFQVKFTDDGNKADFVTFSQQALGNDRFIYIDRVENNGLDIYGKLHTKIWGKFDVYFKFQQDKDGKFNRLDIGQVL